MKIPDVTTSGPTFQPPEQPTQSQKMNAMAHSLLTQTSATLKAAAVSAVSSDPNAPANISAEALKDMSAIDTLAYQINNFTALYGAGGTTPTGKTLADLQNEAIGYANDLMTNCAGNCVSGLNPVISGSTSPLGGMARDFTITNGVVTAINYTQYDSDWTGATSATCVGGVQMILASGIFSGGSSSPFAEPWGLTAQNPDAITNIFVFWSNLMMDKTATENPSYSPNFDAYIWGTASGSGVPNAAYFPAMMFISTFQDLELNASPPGSSASFATALQNLQDILPTDAMIQLAQGSPSPAFPDSSYTGMLASLGQLVTYYQGANPLVPPTYLANQYGLPETPEPFPTAASPLPNNWLYQALNVFPQNFIDHFLWLP